MITPTGGTIMPIIRPAMMPAAGILAAAGQLCEPCRYEIVQHCHYSGDSQPDKQKFHGDRISGRIGSSGKVGQQKAEPAQRRSRQPRNNAADDSDNAENHGEDNQERTHFAIAFSTSSGR